MIYLVYLSNIDQIYLSNIDVIYLSNIDLTYLSNIDLIYRVEGWIVEKPWLGGDDVIYIPGVI